MTAMFTLAELQAAAAVVYRDMSPTPQYRWPLLERRTGTRVWVKHENHTQVGSFKIRGGLVYFEALAASGRKPVGVIGATRGNHGQSLGFAASRYGIPAAVVAPLGNSACKNAAMRALGFAIETLAVQDLVHHRRAHPLGATGEQAGEMLCLPTPAFEARPVTRSQRRNFVEEE